MDHRLPPGWAPRPSRSARGAPHHRRSATRARGHGCALALLALACGRPTPDAAGDAHPATAGHHEDRDEGPASACPRADAVRFAYYSPPRSDPGYEIPGEPPTPYWTVPVGHQRVDDGAPAPGRLDRATVDALGMETLPDEIYLSRPGAPVCRARVAGYLGELIEHGVSNVRVGAITTDCADGDSETHGWATAAPLEGCELVGATEVDLVGLERRDDREVVPDTLTPLAAPYAAAVPPTACTAPCITLHRVSATQGTPSLAEVWVTTLTPEPPDEPCGWDSEPHVGLYVVDGEGEGEGARRIDWPREDGYERVLTLDGVLRDSHGLRVALFTDHAAYGAYDIESDQTMGAGRTITYFQGSEEDGIYRSLAPNCGP